MHRVEFHRCILRLLIRSIALGEVDLGDSSAEGELAAVVERFGCRGVLTARGPDLISSPGRSTC